MKIEKEVVVVDELSVQLERAIESKLRALKGSDKQWKREATAEVERIRNIIRKRNLKAINCLRREDDTELETTV